jgi:hypothetical protein
MSTIDELISLTISTSLIEFGGVYENQEISISNLEIGEISINNILYGRSHFVIPNANQAATKD